MIRILNSQWRAAFVCVFSFGYLAMSRLTRREVLLLLGTGILGFVVHPLWGIDQISLKLDSIPIRGIYLPGWRGVNKSRIQRIANFLTENGLNALMIDVKNAFGELFYQPECDLAEAIGAQVKTIDRQKRSLDFDVLASELKSLGIRLIARHTMFVDKTLYKGMPEFALTIGHNQYWVDMKNDSVLEYNLELLEQESTLGFDEIVLDYIRFPDLPGFGDEDDRCDRIDRIVQAAGEVLKRKNVELGLQVFGYSAWSHYKSNVGQRIGTLQKYADTIYPMLYPSHFYSGSLGYRNPSEHPFEIISTGYREAMLKVTTQCQIIPMIQGFSYTPARIASQINAVVQMKMPGFICWNPAGNHRKLVDALKLI